MKARSVWSGLLLALAISGCCHGFSLVSTRPSASRCGFSLKCDSNDDSSPIGDGSSINVIGTDMKCCCDNVRETGIGTGFYRNGYCSTGEEDRGRHTVCCQVTDEFLQFSKYAGNDLSTPMPQFMFPGLKAGDRWCLCAQRWAEAYNFGMAPKIYLQSTHEKTLDYVSYDVLREYALDGEECDEITEQLDETRERLNKLL